MLLVEQPVSSDLGQFTSNHGVDDVLAALPPPVLQTSAVKQLVDTAATQLPEDVIILVLQHVTSKRDFANLCRVNRQWLELTRPRLCQSAQVYLHDPAYRHDSWQVWEGHVTNFILQGSACEIAKARTGVEFVKELSIGIGTRGVDLSYEMDTYLAAVDQLADLLSRFASVRRVRWVAPNAREAAIAFEALKRLSPTLEQLTLTTSVCADVWSFLATRPMLRTFTVQDQSQFAVDTLPPSICDALTESNVSTLTCNIGSNYALLNVLPTKLRTLNLLMVAAEIDAASTPSPSLRRFDKLDRLALTVYNGSGNERRQTSILPFLGQVLATVHENVQHLACNIYVNDARADDHVHEWLPPQLSNLNTLDLGRVRPDADYLIDMCARSYSCLKQVTYTRDPLVAMAASHANGSIETAEWKGERDRIMVALQRQAIAFKPRRSWAAVMPELQYGEAKNAGDAADDSFCGIVRKLEPTPPGTVRLFDRGDFFSAFGSDAYYVATHHFKTQTVIKKLGKISSQHPDGLPSVTLSKAVAQSFLRDALTTKQLRIEIFEQSGSKSSGKWSLSKSASPGNLGSVEELLFAHSDMLAAPVILSLKLQVKDNVKSVGVAFADTSMQRIGVSEFVDNDLFSNTEALLIQLGVKEILLPADEKGSDYDLKKLRTLVERCNIVATDRKKSAFTANDVEQDLNRLLRGNLQASTRPEFDQKVAMGATAALIAYLGLMANDSNFGAYTLESHDLKQYMKLDASALRALNLMPDPTGTGGNSKNMSVFGLLNRCKTSQGTRMLAQWLKQPLVNIHTIEQRQDMVGCFYEEQELRDELQTSYLSRMPDFHRISKRFQKGVANLEDVVRVYQAVLLLPGLLTALENGGQTTERWQALLQEHFIKPLTEFSNQLQPYREMVEETIDLDELDRHNFVIKPEFDENLGRIKTKLEALRDQLDDEHRKVAKELDQPMDSKVLHFEQHSVYGHCFRLTKKLLIKILPSKAASAIKNKKGFFELRNSTQGLHFTTKTMRDLNNEYSDLSKEYDRKQGSLVKEVVNIAASYCPVLETLNDVLAKLDVIASLAMAALNAPIPYVKPVVKDKGQGSLHLVEARHPCLECMENINFIANDVHLERDVSEFQIITGPNMGGKSTFIRSAGVISLMAQIGSFVPCETATVPIFDSILCRVGAGDSQLKGVSTFMAEMLETSAILKSATRDSLVIIDELGRGTSTYDGFGLAWAISEHLATETRASVLFASHFHELTALAQQVPHVKNLHVVAHVDTKPDSLTGKEITLLYKVEPGVCDQSFGIHVAELASFPSEVIKLAKRKADDLEDFSDATNEPREVANALSPEQVAQGTALVEEFLAEWAKLAPAVGQDRDGDVDMRSNDDVEPQPEQDDAAVEESLEGLLKVYEQFKNRFDESPWLKQVLEQTY
ncbi:MSH2 protein [Microbotryomycetes sp. JL201]|nr:MSH2 protein [Microbotryomycetes sp. JL201]